MGADVSGFATTPEGEPVLQVALSGGGLRANILTYGLTLQDLRLEGVAHPLVLGAPGLAPYLGPMRYFGALVGRFANRIAKGQFEIDGLRYQTPCNDGAHLLHGGAGGSGQRLWTLVDAAPDRARFELVLPDGDMGFPGALTVVAEIALTEDSALAFEITARARAATPCSFAHHSYFNLDGGPDICGHSLEIAAQDYLPVDAGLIPTGEIRAVAGTGFDFRTPEPIGRRGLDHNFCVGAGPRALTKVARLASPLSGLAMVVESTEPGLQVYDGAGIGAGIGAASGAGIEGLEGRRYGPYAGVALETQAWPDAPNQPGFPGAILRPDETYRHQVRYRFERGV